MKRKPEPMAAPKKPEPPPKPVYVDPMAKFETELAKLMADDDLSRRDLRDALSTLIQEVYDAAHDEAYEEGAADTIDAQREGVREALATIGTDWETGRSLLERALDARIFGLGTPKITML